MKIKDSLFTAFLFLVLFSTLHLFSVGCCTPYKILGSEDLINDSLLILEKGKFGIYQLQGKQPEELPEDAFCDYKDVIVEGDVLNINVYHPTRIDWMHTIRHFNEMRGGVRVNQGKISLAGFEPIEIEGMTLPEARETIREALREEVKDADAFLSFRERNSNIVEIGGYVARKWIPIDGKIRLYEVLSKAFIPPDANLYASFVQREGCNLSVDLNRLVRQGDMSQNIVMRPRDKIFIASPTEEFAIVMAENIHLSTRPSPQGYNLRAIHLPAGYISLREALVTAQGISYSNSKCYVQVIRGGLCSPRIYIVPWHRIDSVPNQNLLLIPGDLVYISLSPISNWKILIDELSVSLVLAPFLQFITREIRK
ncbi:MAG: hypothetical protein BGO14_11020 [Chlamydiales bacterium 38-26]|nr:polysaccharide biosynthesis/export family protein [Chlamydiales bacterium]OJV11481.1 MAG: hypothetical protein BGO14_11020 [Chlamydiales bacterium 38-26]